MVRDVGNIELCEILETEPKTQCTVCLSYWNIGILYCTCGHVLHKERGANQQFINLRWTFFQFQSTSSRKEDLMDIDMVKSRETRNTIRLTSWRKVARKSISKSYEIQNSVIEWLKIIDHLTTQEYSLYKINWWLYSNKQGSNTMPVTHRPDFKQVLSTLQRLKQKAEGDSHVPTNSNRNQQWAQSASFLHGGIGKVHGGLLILMKVTMEMHQVLTERGDLLNAVFGKFFWTRLSWIQFILLQIDRLQLTPAHCNRREV